MTASSTSTSTSSSATASPAMSCAPLSSRYHPHQGVSSSSSSTPTVNGGGYGSASAATNGSAFHPAASSSASSASLPQRPRHHVRSMSQESTEFPTVSSFALTPPRRNSHGLNGHHTKMTLSSGHVPPPQSRSSDSSLNSTLMDKDGDSLASASSSVSNSTTSSSVESSPTRSNGSKPSNLTRDTDDKESLPSDDDQRLRHLLNAQANRRPRLMRLTPAFASLPGRLEIPPAPKTAPLPSSGEGTIEFPRMADSSIPRASSRDSASRLHGPSASSSTMSDPRNKTRKEGGMLTPPSGLQLELDMTNLPTPSVEDSTAPQTTSDLPEVRTKSGRLIKPALRHNSSNYALSAGARADSSPASVPASLRAKSTPNTPSIAKVVQFDSQLEHIKVFKFKQKPTAISRTGSPEQTETETEEERDMFPFVNYGRRSPNSSTPGIATPATVPTQGQAGEEQLVLRLPNFPSSARISVEKDVYLERIFLAEDLRSVRGTVRVRNVGFEKWVAIRFTLDNWTTVNEVSAEYSESVSDGSADRFSFSIKLNELLNWPRGAGQHETKTMFLCIRYTTPGQEFWDNNDGLNYQLDFRKRQMPATPLPTPTGSRMERAQTISGPAPTNQQAKVVDMARRHGVQAKQQGGFVEELRRELDKLKTDDADFDRPPIITKKMAAALQGDRASPPVSPGQRPASPMWSSRYDWGESLRNSGSSNSRSRSAVYDYFTSKPSNAANAPTANLKVPRPEVTVQGASPVEASSGLPSDESTPLAAFFGGARNGMFSPAVGDVYAHHRPVTGSLTSSLESSRNNSTASSPTRANMPLSVAQTTNGFLSPLGGGSPEQQRSPGRFHSYPLGRRGSSPFASVNNSADNSAQVSDEEEDQDGSATLTRRPVSRIVTMPKSSLKKRTDKHDGLVLENYDKDIGEPASPQESPRHSSLFSPGSSISSHESETTPEIGTPDDSSSTMDSVLTPRLASARRWSPSPSGRVSGASAGVRVNGSHPSEIQLQPRTAADLSELISKYCWSSSSTPGTTPLPGGGGGTHSPVGIGSAARDGVAMPPGGFKVHVNGAAGGIGGQDPAAQPRSESGSATPTAQSQY